MKKNTKEISLFEISKLAKNNPIKASEIIKKFIISEFDLKVSKIQINNSKVSLNSVNGQIFLDNDKKKPKYFFKFHTEEGEKETVGEYYRAEILNKVGLPVILPIFQSNKSGKQILIYPYISEPTLYEVMEKMDLNFLKNKKYDKKNKEKILNAEIKLDKKICKIALKNLHEEKSKIVNNEAIWQLFYRRLISSKTIPRLDIFYTKKNVILPNKEKISFEQFSKLKWIINNKKYTESIDEIIEKSKEILNPLSRKSWVVTTVHGDDHNGNKILMFEKENVYNLKLFDPAFAGNKIPIILAFVKTIFHDTFAHPFWLYDSQKIEKDLELDFKIINDTIFVNHNWDLNKVAPLRVDLLKIKFKQILKPVVAELKKQKLWTEIDKDFIKKALFCSPFLVMNLLDGKKFSKKTSLFAFSRAVEMGSWTKESILDDLLKDL